jgi:DNA helicase-2/ATP-dependent DNA helicase PcrA
MPDLLANLNAPQLAAVTLPPQHALILAGAGSGKTRVLTTRIAWLISTGQVGPQGILAVTFTNKAAKEMQSRLAAMLPINTRGMWIGTFHGLCNRFLRAHCREAGLPAQFQILDAADQLAAIKRLLKNLNVDDQKFPPRELMHFINAHKEQGIRAAQAEAYDHFTSRRVEWYAEYEAQCQREGVVDFAELLLRSYELLQRNEPLCHHYQARFRHILVDEFQDTNRLQYAWLKLLAGRGGVPPEGGGACLFAVGDDDQSIYAFRGAEIGNMRDLQREFELANVIRLEQNYRSHGNILDAANSLIKQNRGRLGKNLWTEAGAGEPIRVFEAFSDVDEARFIVEEIGELVREGSSPRSDGRPLPLERTVAGARTSVVHPGGAVSCAWRPALLRSPGSQTCPGLPAPDRQPDDDTAFARVVNFPTRGIGTRSIEALQEAARCANSSLYNAAASLAGKAGTSLARFVRLIEDLRSETRPFAPARGDRPDHRQERSAPALSGRQGRPGPTREP